VLDVLKSRIGALLCVVALLGALAWWGSGPDREEPKASAPGASAVAQSPAGSSVAGNDKGLVEIDTLGTKLDAARLFDLGFAGGLTIDRDTRTALEALSTAMPDEASEADMQKLESTLRRGLPPEDAEKAIKLFHDYRDYQADMKLELPTLGTPESQEASNAYFDRVMQMQRKHFDEATAKALFGQDIQNARLGSLASFINRDSGLSPAQRKEQLDALRALLPADQRSLIPDAETAAPAIIDTEPVKR